MHPRHIDIDEDNLRLTGCGSYYRLLAVSRLADYLNISVRRQENAQSVADLIVIVNQQDPTCVATHKIEREIPWVE
jgi:hypothetical protein